MEVSFAPATSYSGVRLSRKLPGGSSGLFEAILHNQKEWPLAL